MILRRGNGIGIVIRKYVYVGVFLGGVDNPPQSNYKEDVAQK